MFEQLARYTMRYQEADLHLGLHSSLTFANSLNPLTLLLRPILTLKLRSQIALFIAKAGYVWVS